MNQVSRWAMAVLVAAGMSIGLSVGMASAQGAPGSASGGEAIAQSPAPAAPAPAAPAPAAPAPAAGMMGEHSMTGQVTEISKTGKVSIKTGIGVLHLHFPPDSLADVKKGDTLTVHMSFEKS